MNTLTLGIEIIIALIFALFTFGSLAISWDKKNYSIPVGIAFTLSVGAIFIDGIPHVLLICAYLALMGIYFLPEEKFVEINQQVTSVTTGSAVLTTSVTGFVWTIENSSFAGTLFVLSIIIGLLFMIYGFWFTSKNTGSSVVQTTQNRA